MGRRCRECDSPLAGRSDKKFCSDDCRTAWHNRRYRQELSAAAQLNRILRCNRRILASIYDAGESKVSLSDSRVSGYDSRFFTAAERLPLWRVRYYCYEFSYELRRGRICRLTRHGSAVST
ncbi:MAG: hypothetical protein IJR25_07510 [Bacteroidales bacterium]|nr:hypothetical protein [Bacteroidales bacterium]